MGEHDDDLESEVQEGAEQETDSYPDTDEDVDSENSDDAASEEPTTDDDKSEL